MQVALRELAHARQVLKQVEAAEAAKAQAREKAALMQKQEWPPNARLVTPGQVAELTQQLSQQPARILHPEVNALAQQWFAWDSPVLQSSVDSATTNQRANQPPIA